MAYKTPKHLRDRIKKHYNEKGPPENSEKKPTFAHPQADPTRFDRAGRSRKANKATEANEAYIASLAGEREARTAAATRRRQEAGIGLQAGLEKKAEDIEAIKKRPLGLAARAGAKRMGDTARTTALGRQLRAARQAQAGTTGTATERAAQAQREPADVAERMGAKQPATRAASEGLSEGAQIGLRPQMEAPTPPKRKSPRRRQRSLGMAAGLADPANRPPRKRNTRLSAAQRQNNRQY